MSVYDFDVEVQPVYLDFLNIGAGYGVLSVPVFGLLDGDVVNSATINITPVDGVGDTITKSVDMVQRSSGYFEWVSSAEVSAHFTLEAADVAEIAAGSYEYSVSVTVTRNGIARAREVQAGGIQCRTTNAGVALIVSEITIDPDEVTGEDGDTDQLTATALDGNGEEIAGQVFVWSSSNPLVASVDQTGLVSFLIPGTAIISAAAQGIYGYADATCNDPNYAGATDKQVAGFLTADNSWRPRSLDFTWLGGVNTVAQGGTGVATVTAGRLLLGAGTSAFTELAPGVSGQAAISNGTAWAARAIVTADVSDLATAVTGITKVGTIGVGLWNGSVITTTYTEAKLKTLTGTASRVTIAGTATDPTVDISAAYVGQTSIVTVGTIGTGIWQGSQIADAYLAALDAAKLTGTVASARLSGSYTGVTAVGTLSSLEVSGTLDVSGLATFEDVTVNGDLTFGGTITATTANVTQLNAVDADISGTLEVDGNFEVGNGPAKFTVTAANGNTAIAGTLNVTGATTLGAVTMGALSVTTLTASGLITANAGLTVSAGATAVQAFTATGATIANLLTVSAGGITVTGNSTITGTLGGITTLTATSIAGTLTTASQPNVTTMAALVTVGTIASGTWNASVIVTTYGGTGLSSYTAGDLPYYATGTALSKLAIGGASAVLTSSGTAPQWSTSLSIVGLTLSGVLTMTAAQSVVIPGATSWAVRNNADSQNNFIVTDAGAATVRAGLTVTAGGLTVSSGTSAFQGVTGTTGVYSSTGQFGGTLTVTTGGLAVTGNSTITGTLGGITTLSATTVTATTLNGTLGTAAQPNVTSVGTLTSLGVGAITGTGLVTITLTTKQLSLNYDGSNHLGVTVASNGAVTYDATGAGAGHTFAEGVTVTTGGVIVSAGGATITGNSTITGTLGGLTGLTVVSGGATITAGGLTVSAGTTGVQAFTATTINATGAINFSRSNGLKMGSDDAGLFGTASEIFMGDYATATKGFYVNYSTGAVRTTHGLTVASGLTVSAGTTAVLTFTATGVATVNQNDGALALKATTANSAIFHELKNSAGTRRGFMGYGSGSSSQLDIYNVENGAIVLTLNNAVAALTLAATTGAATFAGDVLVSKSTPIVTLTTSANTDVNLTLSRTVNTASNWQAYLPAGSTDLRLFSGADRFTFTAAGAFTATAGVTVGSGSDLTLGRAAAVSIATPSTHKIQVKDSTGTTYHVLASNV